MDMSANTVANLFAQLGLDDTPDGIHQFVKAHPLAADVHIATAVFWNDGQRHFLQDSLRQDCEWAVIVDHLNVLLHH